MPCTINEVFPEGLRGKSNLQFIHRKFQARFQGYLSGAWSVELSDHMITCFESAAKSKGAKNMLKKNPF